MSGLLWENNTFIVDFDHAVFSENNHSAQISVEVSPNSEVRNRGGKKTLKFGLIS